MVVSFFFFHLYLGKISNLTHIFQMGWFNHQPEIPWLNVFFVLLPWSETGVITVVFSSSFQKTILSGIPIGSMANCLAPSGRNDMPHFQGSGDGQIVFGEENQAVLLVMYGQYDSQISMFCLLQGTTLMCRCGEHHTYTMLSICRNTFDHHWESHQYTNSKSVWCFTCPFFVLVACAKQN